MKWLRCLFSRHEWVSWLDMNEPKHVMYGFTKRVCPDCKAVEYAPGAAPGLAPGADA